MRNSRLTIPKLTICYKKAVRSLATIPTIINTVLSCLLLFFLFQLVTSRHAWNVLGSSIHLESSEIINLINEQRTAHSVPPLVENEQLSQAALNKANDMVINNYWDHYAPNRQTPWQFIQDTGYIYKYAGENLARGFHNENQIVEAWMNSPSHRANILSSNFTQTGVAAVVGRSEGRDSVLVVQLFATPFTAEELEQIEKQGAVVVNQTSPTLPAVTKPNYSPFLSAKTAVAAVLVTVLLAMIYDIKRHAHLTKTSLLKRYWVNSVLICLCTYAYVLTILLINI